MSHPRRRANVACAVAAVAVLGLSGCSQGSKAAAAETPAAPEGVAKSYATAAEEIRAGGGETTVGEWRIGYIVEKAEAWHNVINGYRSYREPAAGETHHIEIVPFEAKTGRIVPDVPVRLQVVA